MFDRVLNTPLIFHMGNIRSTLTIKALAETSRTLSKNSDGALSYSMEVK